MSSHAFLPPSSAKRWIACTLSAHLEAQFEDRAGIEAKRGTLAHLLAETMLKEKYGLISTTESAAILKECKLSPLYDDAMQVYMEDYVAYVVETFETIQAATPDAAIFIEVKLDMTEYVPEGFGTGDVTIIGDGRMRNIDLKYGKGVLVSAERNEQMMLYALGAIRKYGILYDIDVVEMTIYQPRRDNISDWELPTTELRKWAEEVVKPRAKLAFEGKGEFVPGEHCHFCRGKAVCRANAEKNLEIAQYDFRDGHLLSDQEVADILSRADQFQKWLTAVEEFALESAVQKGKRWPGYKLVEGRSNRVYSDREKAADALKAGGFSDTQIYEPQTLLSITAMEKAIGKKAFSVLLSDLIDKPPGKPALVPVSDKRPELNSIESAQNDFS
ncbi:DUF2800 domain-containing protein [Chitinophaga rhizosphaerae]|uniref:DUF2800 domain-containing protein n=1 Tax=Chitinophaga rhizosphaerae TaxID=1864947 RepID=UPI000F804984|nr:DUF2800 domain-containing protein [Chitinophaga rhizosphaerae]